MPGTELTRRGLECFTAGDLREATRAWLQARTQEPHNPRLEAYLEHVRALAPAVYAEVAAELGLVPAGSQAQPPSPPRAPAPLAVPPPGPEVPRGAVALAGPLPPAPAPAEPPAGPKGVVALAEPLPPPKVREEPGRSSGFRPIGRTATSEAFRVEVIPARGAVEDEGLPELDLDAIAEPLPPAPAGPPEAVGVPAGAGVPPEDAESGADPWGAPSAAAAVALADSASALGLVTPPAPPAPPEVSPDGLSELTRRLDELYELDDFSGALAVADEILRIEPAHQRATALRAECARQLRAMYESKIGDKTAVPRVLAAPDQLIWLDLDHRSGFVLAQIDGVSTFEEIVEVTGMDPLESYRILAKLVQDGVVGSS